MMIDMSLADVLEAYAVETPTGNDQQVLQKWMKKYPQYSAELMDFAAARAVVLYAPEEEISAEEEARYREVGLKNFQAFLSNSAAPQTVLSSLTASAAEKGLNKAKFAAAVGVSLSLLMYLEKKRLEFSTIPKAVVRKISDVIEAGEQQVAAYLSTPPEMQPQASFKTAIRPKEVKLKSFAEAVREDQILSPEEKKNLLDLE